MNATLNTEQKTWANIMFTRCLDILKTQGVTSPTIDQIMGTMPAAIDQHREFINEMCEAKTDRALVGRKALCDSIWIGMRRSNFNKQNGGARPGAGRKPEDGSGNLSKGIRLELDKIRAYENELTRNP